MLKRRKRDKMGVREEPQIRCPGHLKWVRGHECAALDSACQGKIEAAHVRVGTDGGMGMKPGDNWTYPLCSFHHAEQHRIGERTFAIVHNIKPAEISMGLWHNSPHRLKRGRE